MAALEVLDANKLFHYRLWSELWKNNEELKTVPKEMVDGPEIGFDGVPTNKEIHRLLRPFITEMTKFDEVRSVLNPMWTFPKDPDDNTLCHLCVINFQPDVLETLLRATSLNNVHYLSSKNRNGFSPLILALKLFNFVAINMFVADHKLRCEASSGQHAAKFMGVPLKLHPNTTDFNFMFDEFKMESSRNHSLPLSGSFVVQYSEADSALLHLIESDMPEDSNFTPIAKGKMEDFYTDFLSTLFTKEEALYSLDILWQCCQRQNERLDGKDIKKRNIQERCSWFTEILGCPPLRTNSAELFGQNLSFSDTEADKNTEPAFCKIFVRVTVSPQDDTVVRLITTNTLNAAANPDNALSNGKYNSKKKETWKAMENDFPSIDQVYKRDTLLPEPELNDVEYLDTMFLAALCRNWHYFVDRMKMILWKINPYEQFHSGHGVHIHKFFVKLFGHKLSTAPELGEFSSLLVRRRDEFVPSILLGIFKWGTVSRVDSFMLNMTRTLFSLFLVSRHARPLFHRFYNDAAHANRFPVFGDPDDPDTPAGKLKELGITNDKPRFVFNLINMAWLLGDWEVIEWRRTFVDQLVQAPVAGNIGKFFLDKQGELLTFCETPSTKQGSPLYGRRHVFDTFDKARALIRLLLRSGNGITQKHFLQNLGAGNVLVDHVNKRRGLFSYEKLFPMGSNPSLSIGIHECTEQAYSIGMSLIQNTCDLSEFFHLLLHEVTKKNRHAWGELATSFGDDKRTMGVNYTLFFENPEINPVTIRMAEAISSLIPEALEIDQVNTLHKKMMKISENLENIKNVSKDTELVKNIINADNVDYDFLGFYMGRRRDHKTLFHLLAEDDKEDSLGLLIERIAHIAKIDNHDPNLPDFSLALCCKDTNGNTFLHSVLDKAKIYRGYDERAAKILKTLVQYLPSATRGTTWGVKALMLSRNLQGKTVLDLVRELHSHNRRWDSWLAIKDIFNSSPDLFIYDADTYRNSVSSTLKRRLEESEAAVQNIKQAVTGTASKIMSFFKW